MSVRSSLVVPRLTVLALAASIGVAKGQAAAPVAAPDTAPYTLTGTAALVSDYRFRGISQTYRLPAVQAGFEVAHASGFYFGNWDSNVSGNSYNNGASLEMDVYGGYRFEPVKDLNADVGVLFYVYPGAKLDQAPGVASGQRYNNTELYAGITSGPFNAKVSYALTDYFGLNDQTAGYAYYSPLTGHGSSRGTAYFEFNYTLDLGDKLGLGVHLGHTAVRHYGELSFTDAKVSLNKEWLGLNFGAAVVATDARRAYYQIADSSGNNARKVGTPTIVLSAGKSF